MIAGRMTYRVEVYEPQRTTSSYGSERIEYVLKNTIHAERVSFNGSQVEEVVEHFADYRVMFNVRDVHGIKENWRVKQLGGYLYTVASITPNLSRGYVTLNCIRVNE